MKQCTLINNTLFTDNNVPFQLFDEEDIIYINEEAYIYISMKDNTDVNNKYKSFNGILFITQFRLIYKALDNGKVGMLESFFVPLENIINVVDNRRIDFVSDKVLQSAYLGVNNGNVSVLFTVIKDLLDQIDVKRDSKDDFEDTLPYYSDLYR